MGSARGREPQVEVRRHRTKTGELREYTAVRWFDADGVRRRMTCASLREAELERAKLAIELGAGPSAGHEGDVLLTLAVWSGGPISELER